MKIEPRGKYPGVKVHLDEKECQKLIELLTPAGPSKREQQVKDGFNFAWKLASKITELQEEQPSLLKERTEEEIRAELETERDKSIAKLAAMAAGEDWKKVKG